MSLFKILNTSKSKDSKEIANKILDKLSRTLGFQYYKPEVLKNGIKSQINWKNDYGNIQGKSLALT